ncbi:hypothetical protein AB0399_14430 [Streptomyces sp. NPDC088194]|uniref:hypothetical protein n=1 Tax=Streptomyces sp. NPDC088194 TaxID=3154931 RepID=UPI00344B0A73
MSTTDAHDTHDTHANDPQSREAAPSEPHAPDAPDAPEQGSPDRTRAQSTLAWTTVGWSAALCTTGAVLSLTGHQETGIALIRAGSLAGAIRIRK